MASFPEMKTIAVAVSGGADSMALSLLMHEWAHPLGKSVIGLTVDHQLRSNSTQEATQVNDWFKLHSIEHHILTWETPPSLPLNGLQTKARKARYHLLEEWCKNANVDALMTAHHAQDQLETFLMRLSKGSGLTGLCSIQSIIKTNWGHLCRPLLKISPEQLKETLVRFNQPFIQDPSNENTDFTRVRWRNLLPLLAPEGLDSKALQLTIERLQSAENLLEEQTNTALTNCVALLDDANATLDWISFLKLPSEIGKRILLKVTALIGNQNYPCRYKVITGLYTALLKTDFKGATAGGCYFQRKKLGQILVKKDQRKLIE
jgi:tRNA(Ile)-lysidine synthase